MWNFEILGVSLYHIAAWLYIYSFLGWVWESAFISFKQKKLVNRGFVTGPLCTIYGVGAVSVYLILRPLGDNPLLVYLGGVAVATVLEYITAVLMEAIFHACWWDYSTKKFNFQGKICLGSSVAWGFFTLIMFKVLQPFVELVTGLVDQETGQSIIIAVTVLYAADFAYSMTSAVNLGQKLGRLQLKLGEVAEYFLNTKIMTSVDEFREKWENYTIYSIKTSFREKVDLYQEKLAEQLESRGLTQYRDAAAEKLSSLRESYMKAVEKGSFGARRFMRAYPSLSRISRFKIKRNIKKKNKRERKEK
ncbi:putative ABC transporter permease [Murimonas intestini]|uniref:Membrane protein n=1 Tax=Murimonas intestini TaxID=1337051 RepID=A0AB73T9A8_9FIRM|nr:putative ABC transporter permease [Murimonas intestini]MCR1839358.1 putative ABC transporter permease [Murimonas intestini]MCR1864653.1 putative ABC transporter permease [Murimonas intestini]MCR1882263.1 putative ABC transporter permease [Murimonas intestini]